jgi:hypothetical protein
MCKGMGDVTHITMTGDASDIMRRFGTRNPDFFARLVHQIANAGSKGQYPDETSVRSMLAFVITSNPIDETDALLAAQIAAANLATMRAANRLAYAESVQEHDSAERAFNKLARTTTVLIEARQRYRIAREQKGAVQHFSVTNGAQAIVANVTLENPETLALTDARQPEMRVIEELQRAPVKLRHRQRNGGHSSA